MDSHYCISLKRRHGICIFCYICKGIFIISLWTEVWQFLWWWFHVHLQPLHPPWGSGSPCIVCHQHQQRSHMPGKTWWWYQLERPPQFNRKLGGAWVMAFILPKVMSAAFELIVAAPKWGRRGWARGKWNCPRWLLHYIKISPCVCVCVYVCWALTSICISTVQRMTILSSLQT